MSKHMFTIGKTTWCRCCEKHQPHTHGGIQEFPNARYILWNCCKCNATSAERIHDAADFDDAEQDAFLQGTRY